MIPTIDPQVKHVGISHLRKLNADILRNLQGALVICDNSEPIAVIVSYETFLRIQQAQIVLSNGVDKAIGMIEAVTETRARMAKGTQGALARPLREKGDVKR